MFESRIGLRCLAASSLLFVALPALPQPATSTDTETMLRRADAAQHPLDEGVMRIRTVVRERDEPAAETELDVYVQGAERVLCVFRTGKFRERRILIREDLNKVWLFAPGTSRAIPITANQVLMGGASIADVARRKLAGNYDAVLRSGSETVDGVDCHVLDLEARQRRSTYAAAVLWIGKDDGLPRKMRLSLRSGKVAKEIRFVDYSDGERGPRLRRMEIDHLLRKERGMLTTLEFLDYRPRVLDNKFFEPDHAREIP